MNRKHSDFFIALFISIIAGIPLILPYFHEGFFPTHDGEWAVVRLGDMFRSLKDLQFPVRFSGNLNFGYGYPLFNFAYPFPYYLGVLIHFFNVGFVDAIKFLFAVSVPLSSFFMFFAAKEIWKNTFSATMSSILYIYYPYRIVDLYVRGSLGESLSFVLFPLILFLMFQILKKKNRIIIILLAFFYAVLILTHNIMAVLFTLFLCSFLLFKYTEKNKNVVYCFFALLLGLLVSTFFWVPALLEKQYILLSQIPIADRNLYFVTLQQLIIPKWGYGPPTSSDGFSYQLGIAQLGIFIVNILFVLYFVLHKKIKFSSEIKHAIFLLFIILVLILSMLSIFSFVWKLPLLSEINYPWTLLGPLGFVISLQAGFFASYKIGRTISLCLVIIAVVTIVPFARPKEYINKDDQFYLTNEATTTSSNELMPVWVKKHPSKRFEQKAQILNGTGEIQNILYNSKQFSILGQFDSDSAVRINTIYYPGWNVAVNGKQAEIDYSNELGVMDIKVLRGKNEILGTFHETTLRIFANTVTLVVSGILFLLLLKKSVSLIIKKQ